MAADFDLLVVGDLNADLVLLGADPVPAFGQAEKLVDSGTLTVGASSAITACGAARLGLRTALVSVVGDDGLGRYLFSALQACGVDVSHCVVDPTLQTGISVILARPGEGGDRAILTAPGSVGAVSAQHVPPELLARARHVHCGAYFLQRALRHDLPDLFQRARANGSTCSLDTNWDPSGAWAGDVQQAMAQSDVLFPNREEALRLAGARDLDAAIASLAANGVRTVATKLGEVGALVRQGGRLVYATAPRTEAIDATGAGDSFDAGFLYGYLSRWPLEQTLALAVACGTLSTRAVGGTKGQATLEEAQALAQRVSLRTPPA